MPDTTPIASLVSQMPRPAADGKRGGILDNIDKPALDKTIDELVKSGGDGVKAIIDMLVDKQPEKDSEARHALNAIVFRVGAPGKEAERKAVAEAIAAAIGGEGGSAKPKEVQAFLIRQLQYVGKGEVAATLGKVLLDAELCDPACAALVAIKDGAGEQLRAALPKAVGRGRMAIIQALGQARDAWAAALIRPHLSDTDRDTRICAGWALAVIGDAGCVDALIKAAGGADAAGNAVGWARKFFDKWFGWARRSALEPIKRVALTLKNRLANILTYCRHPITNGVAEGLNSKIMTIKRLACGYRNPSNFKTAILFFFGGLAMDPE